MLRVEAQRRRRNQDRCIERKHLPTPLLTRGTTLHRSIKVETVQKRLQESQGGVGVNQLIQRLVAKRVAFQRNLLALETAIHLHQHGTVHCLRLHPDRFVEVV